MRYVAMMGHGGQGKRQLGRLYSIVPHRHYGECFVDGDNTFQVVIDPELSDKLLSHKLYDYVVLEIPK